MQFKVGDVVVGKDKMSGLDISGHEGVIIAVNNMDNNTIYKVEFFERFSNRLHGVSRRCWNVLPGHIDLVDRIDDDIIDVNNEHILNSLDALIK